MEFDKVINSMLYYAKFFTKSTRGLSMSLKKILSFNHKEKKVMLCVMLTAMMMMTTGFTKTTLPEDWHQVTIVADGKTITTTTNHTNPAFILGKNGVKLRANDEYHLEKDGRNTKITVYRAVPVTVSYDGQTKSVMTSKQTVGDALIELGYNLEDVEASQGLNKRIQANMDIVLTDSAKKKAALQRMREEQMRPRVQTEMGMMAYTAAYTMEATAYLPTDGSGTGMTAMGIPAQRGVVAVDPRVIPLGSRVYIPGYGVAIAADTGGAIRGQKVDLCMETYGECMNFGRRSIEVYVLA
ncbi:3D (Asp-Asp-Asp) domain-containing protein [Selenomonas ruminantium]|uniref:3D (Asp-Asp-Asp) domain-containing protein n=2 Tax=Selenomonas ruminantium TaxID=971 RepID=A0A1H0PGR9_SELRU|nr:3D (Asp-Asp-Asp) domain-containing protein [Selenomonas ruminantium]